MSVNPSPQTIDSYIQPFSGEQIGAPTTRQFRQAVQYAAWWNRMALDIAGGEPHVDPALLGALTAARTQNNIAERLLETTPALRDAA